MHQTDLSLAEKMNLQCPAIIANQCDRWSTQQHTYPFGTVRMVSTDTRGVGINRNLALALADAEIVLFADDDMVYYDGALQGVADAFRQLPDADVILFSIDMTRNGEVFDERRSPIRRLHLWNALKYGTCRMAVRRSALQRSNVWFSTLFGGGCRYGSGEDSLLLCHCFRAGLRVYSHSLVLGRCAKDSSTWFSGFNEKFMFDKGAWIACAFPTCKHLIKWYFIRKFTHKSQLSAKDTAAWVNRGVRAFDAGLNYDEYLTQKGRCGDTP